MTKRLKRTLTSSLTTLISTWQDTFRKNLMVRTILNHLTWVTGQYAPKYAMVEPKSSTQVGAASQSAVNSAKNHQLSWRGSATLTHVRVKQVQILRQQVVYLDTGSKDHLSHCHYRLSHTSCLTDSNSMKSARLKMKTCASGGLI